LVSGLSATGLRAGGNGPTPSGQAATNTTTPVVTNATGNGTATYEVVLAPNPYNNTPPPIFYVNQLINSPASQGQLQTMISQFDPSVPITYAVINETVPSAVGGAIIDQQFTNITVAVQYSAVASVFGVLINHDEGANVSAPTPQQIYQGIAANNSDLPDNQIYKGFTFPNGTGILSFANLTQDSYYTVYIVQGADVPYQPILGTQVRGFQVNTTIVSIYWANASVLNVMLWAMVLLIAFIFNA